MVASHFIAQFNAQAVGKCFCDVPLGQGVPQYLEKTLDTVLHFFVRSGPQLYDFAADCALKSLLDGSAPH